MRNFETMLGLFVGNYPWVAFFVVWLLWVASTLWEFRLHHNKQLTRAWLLSLFCFLAFAMSTVEVLGLFRWLLTAGVLIIGWVFVNRVLRDKPPNNENAV